MLGRTALSLTFALVAAAAAAQPLPAPRPSRPPRPPAPPAAAPGARDALRALSLEGFGAIDLREIEDSARDAVDAVAGLDLDLQDVVGVQPLIALSETADYDRGTSYLDSGRYDRAVEAFDKVIAKNGKKADGAMYWKAYALNHLGKRDEAVRTIEDLQKKFPSSRWTNDAKALLMDVRQASGQPVAPDKAGDEELKLIALNGLMRRDPDRALPMIEQLLAGSASPRVKERALFVLAQSGSPRAKTLLADVAKGKGNPDLQLKALDYLGAFGSGPDVPLLVDVYKTSGDVDVKKRVIRSLAMTGRRGFVFDAFGTDFTFAYSDAMEQARHALERVRADMERNLELSESERAKIKAQLERELSRMRDGVPAPPPPPPAPPSPPTPPTPPTHPSTPSGSAQAAPAAPAASGSSAAARAEREKAREARAKEAGDALWQLYQAESSLELKREILRNMRFSAQAERLAQIARTEPNADLRAAAVQGLLLDRSPKTTETLVAIYKTEKDVAVRRQIIDSLGASGSAATLVQLARQETDPTLRKRLVERLSTMKDKEAMDYMMEILKK